MIHKVIVINPINYCFETLRPPFGLLTIATKFIDKGVQVIWIDADVIRDPKMVMNEVQQHHDADLIAMGGMHTAYRNIKEISQSIHEEELDIPIVVGGRVASTLGHLIWENMPNVSILCKQEGEYVVESLCENFYSLHEVSGIEYRQNGEIIQNPPAATVKSMKEVPPLRWDLLSPSYYQYPKYTGRLLTARGCPYCCYFCRCDGQQDKYRSMDIADVIRDVDYMVKSHSVRRVVIMDELFLQNKQRVNEFCDCVKDFNIAWQCSGRGDSLTERDRSLLQKMRAAGCDRIVMGIESGSRKMLKLMNKKLNLCKAERSIELIREAGIRVGPSFIFGYPGETRQTALESVKWRKKMNLPHRFFYAQPYPGSELYGIWKKKFSIGPVDEENYILGAPGLKEIKINFTDMPDWKLKLLALECIIRLNSLMWIIMYFMIYPLKRMSPRIPDMAIRFAVRMKRVFTRNSYTKSEKSCIPLPKIEK